MMVMIDESTGNKYMRAVDHKGLGQEGDLSWLVKDMHQELKAWGHPGGGRNEIILESDGEPAIASSRPFNVECVESTNGDSSKSSASPVGGSVRDMSGRVRGRKAKRV